MYFVFLFWYKMVFGESQTQVMSPGLII